jgi:hypothetical protein
MLRHAAMVTLLALATIGLAESRGMPSTKTTATLSSRPPEAVSLRLGKPLPARLHAPPPAQTKVRVLHPESVRARWRRRSHRPPQDWQHHQKCVRRSIQR